MVEIGLDDGSIIEVDKNKLDFIIKKGDKVEVYGEKDNITIMPEKYVKKDTPVMQLLKAIIIVIAIIFIIIMAKLIISGISDSFTNDSDNQQNIDNNPVAQIGEKLNVGDISYTVKSVRIDDRVGTENFNQEANGQYIIIEIEITNNSNETVTISDSYFELLYGDKTYDSDSTASLYISMEDDVDSIWYEELNPDLTLTGKIVFDVTEEVANSNDTKLQVQTGYWGTQTGIISLER